MTIFSSVSSSILRLVHDHWPLLLALAVAAWMIVLIYRVLVTYFGPADLTGSGVMIGAPKIFDNRSLNLMVEGLNTNLQGVNAVSQNVTQNLGSYQQGESDSSKSSIHFAGSDITNSAPTTSSGSTAARPDGASSSAKTPAPSPKNTTGDKEALPASPFAFSPAFGMSAPDALGDQVNLSYQIFNQRILNERAISDRVFGDTPRLQVVLGFQVSIDPPAGTEECAAVAEIGLDFGDVSASSSEKTYPISIVALIPQERTYNVASVSSSENSIDGSIVSRVMAAGGSSSRKNDRLFLHRDADTIAFERDPTVESGAFGIRKPKEGQPGIVFGWEFHPVLGRRTVTPGPRLMLAVVSLPCGEDEKPKLQVRARGYWLSYDRKHQTTNVRWAWWPFPGRQGGIPKWKQWDLLDIISSEQIDALTPKIEDVSWVDTGAGAAVVQIQGRNFFTGTQILLGKDVYDKDNGLTIKSDRVLQLRTTVEALGQGNALLNGRYGLSLELAKPAGDLPAKSIKIGANYQILPGSNVLQPVYVFISYPDGNPISLEPLLKLPYPILYLNGHPLDRPYSFEYWSSKWPSPVQQGPDNSSLDIVRLTAWAQADWLRSDAVLLLRFPFCGSGWAALTVLQSSESILRPAEFIRLGSDETNTTLVISCKSGFPGPQECPTADWVVRLDKDYALQFIDGTTLLLTIPSKALDSYSTCILKNGPVNLLLDIPGKS